MNPTHKTQPWSSPPSILRVWTFVVKERVKGIVDVKLSSAIVMCSRMKDIYVARGEDQWRELK
jgi:hypothetical protein